MRRFFVILFVLAAVRSAMAQGADAPLINGGTPQLLEGTVTLVDTNRGLVVLQERGRAKALRLDPFPTALRVGERVAVEGELGIFCSAFPDFPNQPAGSGVLGVFETSVGGEENSLSRLRGWLQPPADGKYTFWLAADAEAELWLSTNALPIFAKRISVVTEATRPGEWNRDGEQQSDPVTLKGGQTYYIEARQRQGNAPGFLAVAWRGPNFERRILDGKYLSLERPVGGATNGILREYWTNCFLTRLTALPSNSTNVVMLALNHARVRSLGKGDLSSPRRIRAGRAWSDDRNFAWAELEGTVSFAAADHGGLTLELADAEAWMTVRIVNWDGRPASSLFNRRVRVQGVCEQTANAKREPVVGLLWMQDARQLTLLEDAPDRAPKPTRAVEPVELPGGGQEIRIADLPETAAERLEFETNHFRIRGVVTFMDRVSNRDLLFVQDDSGSMRLRVPPALFETRPIAPAQQLEADGEVHFALGGSMFEVSSATVSGWGQMPKPLPFPERADARKTDGQWVEAQGVVRAAKNETLFVMANIGMLPVWVGGGGPSNALAPYVDALVTLRGVFTLQLSNGPALLVPAAAFIQVREAAPTDPFGLPTRPIRQIRAEEASPSSLHRVKVAGVVTYRDGRMLCVQDEAGGARVLAVAPGDIAVGDRVEVAGFPDRSGETFSLVESLLRTVAPGRAPIPAAMPLDDLLVGRLDAMLVNIDGVVLEQKTRNGYHQLELQNGQRAFAAVLAANAGSLPSFPVGSRIQITGVNRLQFANPESAGADANVHPVPATMDILLRSPADVVLLQRPPWWNWRYTLGVVAALAVVLAVALVWIRTLRRRVEERTRALQETMGRLKKETEISATLAERDRLAAEIHDTLEQGLSGIMLQLDSVDSRLKGNPEEARGFLEMARRMVSFSRGEVRNSLWNLESSLLQNGNLGAALAEIARQMSAGDTVKVGVELAGTAHPLPPAVEHHLLRCAQEALNNALKHAGATTIQIKLSYHEKTVQIAVVDNGRGFEPDSVLTETGKSLGLRNLRSRSWKIKARLEVISSPGRGTTIQLTVPLRAGAEKPTEKS
jgi:signal transduction histidine kinase